MGESVIIFIGLIFVPIALIIASIFIWRSPQPPGGLGYRTARAERSPEAWYTAQVTFAKLTLFTHIPVLVLTAVLGCIIIINRFTDEQAIPLIIVAVFIEMVVLIVDIAVTENKLKRLFDKNGKLK